jgi:isopentenyl-diphosphate delta-isomerase
MNPADQLVILLDPDGSPIGEQRKSSVHHADTPLHLAFSLYLFDQAGRLLMTRRALRKATWPGVWTNTCCGHPMPGESIPDAIQRRLRAELHLDVTELRCVLPEFAYRARDASGVWENEVCPVFVGVVVSSDALRPNTEEAVDWVWTPWADVVKAMAAAPFAFSPWSVEQVHLMPAGVTPRPTEPR